ncbi:MAG: NAD(P)-binding domain-containing protein [Anaerolineales bacterium]|nr:NAD(P)-binding domain-containing protein [Anaerolineales bacterium]
MDNYTDIYCIIGAGASGITAAKNLKAAGIPCHVFEREDEVGGNWYFGKPNSSVYQSTHLISSKPLSAYTDFPMPDDYPDYPNHEQVLAYLRSYAQHFGIYDLITFNTSVERLERDEEGYWLVSLSDGSTRRYKGVIIANGHHWHPQYPHIEGHFDGTTLHSADYKTPDIFKGKRVLVIGGGNSGCDIAVDAAHVAAKTLHSMRRGYHYIPKYVFGKPTDQFAEVAIRLGTPRFLQRLSFALIIRGILGTPQQYGLQKPDHHLLESHPTVNSQLLYHVGHGDITPKPHIQRFNGSQVEFVDGTSEQVDIVVYATGFNITFPFIDTAHLNYRDGKPHLFLQVFHPDYDNLFVAGLIQPDSGQFWLVDYQCQLIARLIQNPNHAAAFRAVKRGPAPDIRGGRKLNTERHFLEVNHHLYRKTLLRFLKEYR